MLRPVSPKFEINMLVFYCATSTLNLIGGTCVCNTISTIIQIPVSISRFEKDGVVSYKT